MEELIAKLNKKFDGRFQDFKLFDVVYDRAAGVCTFCFLFPVTKEDPGAEDRQIIANFLQEFFELSSQVRVKFKKSFLDPQIVTKEVKNFFETNHKGLAPYISEENIYSSNSGLDVKIEIALNEDVLSMINETTVKQKLIAFLGRRFIANFDVTFKENQEKLPDEIDVDDIPNITSTSPRFQVNIIKKVFGGEITPKPEYIKNITSPKTSVILAGKTGNFVKKSFVIKKGKRQGEEKSYYSFTLQDSSGTIDCVYFCPKSTEKIMDAMAENSEMLMFLFVGNVQKGLSDKLTYYIKKMAVCQPVAVPVAQKNEEISQPLDPFAAHKVVVMPEIIETMTQDTLFAQAAKYNDTIMNNNIVVFDIETTGLDPERCEITEIGAVKIINGQIKERFASFVRTQNPIPPEVTALTHITNEMIADAPKLEDVVIDFYNYTRGCIISGYNVIDFDMKFIKKAGSKIGLKFDNTMLDTLIIAKQAGLRTPNYKLGTVVKACGITLVDAHRAYNDAQATAEVLLHLSRLKK